MPEIVADRLQIAYHGPALNEGRMRMLALAAGLRGQALLTQRVGLLLYGDEISFDVEVDASFERGSLIIPVHILSTAIQQAEDLLSGKGFTAFVNLLAFLGFFSATPASLYWLFKQFRGRRIEKPEDIKVLVDLKLEIPLELVLRVYNDNEVQTHLRKTIDPLHQHGVDEFQTRRDGVPIATVYRSDLHAADEAEVEELTRDEEVLLDIEKAALRRTLAWHFSDGRTHFDARIEDNTFWKRVEAGEAFGDGDRLRVHLNTVAKRTSSGALKVDRRIPKVIEVEHVARRQLSMFGEQPGAIEADETREQ